MRKALIVATVLAGIGVPVSAQGNSTDPLAVSSASSIAGAFARTSVTREEQLQRAVAYVDRVCSSNRRRAQRECSRVWGIINAARNEASARQAAEQR